MDKTGKIIQRVRCAPGKTWQSRHLVRKGTLVSLLIVLSGCVSIGDVNQAIGRIDRVWQLEYQRTEDEFRYRVIEADYQTTYQGVKRTFLDLGMAIQSGNPDSGLVVAEATAPTPLSREEWKEVARIENPRSKEIGGWFLELRGDPKNYIVTLGAGLKSVSGKTFVLLEYSLDNPQMRGMGIRPSKYAPPLAVQLGCAKFWNRLTDNLRGAGVPPPRRRMNNEKEARAMGAPTAKVNS